MRGPARGALLACLSATALVAAGCSGDAGGPATTGSGGGTVTVRGCQPEQPLVPAQTNESCGNNVLDLAMARLVRYHPDTAKPELDLAESIETSDNQHFTVKLRKDATFSDGTAVRARHFVDAWNHAVANATRNEYVFAPIQGYADVVPRKDPDGSGPRPAPPARSKTMSGLRVVDDTTFTIATTEKIANLTVRLGAGPFAPLPDAFFKDPKAFGDKPVGAGPYVVSAWTKNQEIRLTKNPRYTGRFPGAADTIVFKVFADSDAAYNELVAGNLDVIEDIPTSAMIGGRYQQDLPGRYGAREAGGIHLLVLPPARTDPTYRNPTLRQAISMAIDRDLIAKQIYNGSRAPADGWVSPVVDGAKPGQCGEYCTYDPEKAKTLLRQVGGVPGGKLAIAYPADAGPRSEVEATCNSIKNTLDVPCVPTPVADFATFRAKIESRTQPGLLRSAWGMDYPSIESFLTPLYTSGGGANVGDYRNPMFDATMRRASAAPTLDAANALYQQAEALLAADMPSIPLWYAKTTYAWSTRVDHVKATAAGPIDYARITLK